jgi:hypothetical protein
MTLRQELSRKNIGRLSESRLRKLRNDLIASGSGSGYLADIAIELRYRRDSRKSGAPIAAIRICAEFTR